MVNDAVKYFQMDVSRDPSRERTNWILSLLLKRPHRADEIQRLSENNGLGFKPSTYSRDLTGLVKRKLVNPPMIKGGTYMIDPIYGLSYIEVKGIKAV